MGSRQSVAENERRKLEKLLESKQDANLHIRLAELLKRDFHDFKRARAHFEAALLIEPENTFARNNLAMILKSKFKDYERARAHLMYVIRVDPNHAVAHNNLGVILHHYEDIEQARIHFETAVRIKPDYANAQRNLASLNSKSPPQNRKSSVHEPVLSLSKLEEDLIFLKEKINTLEGNKSNAGGPAVSDTNDSEDVHKKIEHLTAENAALKSKLLDVTKRLELVQGDNELQLLELGERLELLEGENENMIRALQEAKKKQASPQRVTEEVQATQ